MPPTQLITGLPIIFDSYSAFSFGPNYSGPMTSYLGVGTSLSAGPLVQSFTVPASGVSSLNSAEFLFLGSPGQTFSTISVSLLSDSAGKPSTLIKNFGSFGGSFSFKTGDGGGVSVGMALGSQAVTASTRYWLQLSDPSNPASWATVMPYWLLASGSSSAPGWATFTPQGACGVNLEYFSDGTGVVHSTAAGHGAYAVLVLGNT